VVAGGAGRVGAIDNRRLARVAKLAGAPHDACAGAVIQLRLGDTVQAGQPLFTLHARAPGELAYALAYAHAKAPIVAIDAPS
jgi:thymidine phosphorylase